MTQVAEQVRPFVERLIGGETPLSIQLWDGSCIEAPDSPAAIIARSPRALRRILWSPNELGVARAFVAGELDIEGDIFALFRIKRLLVGEDREHGPLSRLRTGASLVAAARAVGALKGPLEPPPEEVRLHGLTHTRKRDAEAIAHHYDVSNDFYRLVLGETMTYSCAYFAGPALPSDRLARRRALDAAQSAKYDLVCRKLDLKPGMRLLDVGCGWGGMVMHAVRQYGVHAVGVTLSREQFAGARARVAEAALGDSIEIRLQDYRNVVDGPYDAISSIGMFEHVGLAQMDAYCATLHSLLRPGGRLLNHGICRPSGSAPFGRRSFMGSYVFPDAELHDVGIVAAKMAEQGFEVRHVESLSEHYALTLRCWLANLEENWDEVLQVVSPGRARVWRLYMAACAAAFEAGRISVHQLLGVKATARPGAETLTASAP